MFTELVRVGCSFSSFRGRLAKYNKYGARYTNKVEKSYVRNFHQMFLLFIHIWHSCLQKRER